MTRLLPGVIAMAIIVVASNILVQFQLGNWLTWGALSYPFAFLVTDVTNRVYGAFAARRIVLAGFVVGIACSLIAAGLDKTTLRIALASGAAFLLAQLTDIRVFAALRGDAKWWKAPLVSSMLGSILDTALFFSIAFSANLQFLEPAADIGWANEPMPLLGTGPVVPLWVSLGAADWMVKICLSLLVLIPFRLIVADLLRQNASR